MRAICISLAAGSSLPAARHACGAMLTKRATASDAATWLHFQIGESVRYRWLAIRVRYQFTSIAAQEALAAGTRVRDDVIRTG